MDLLGYLNTPTTINWYKIALQIVRNSTQTNQEKREKVLTQSEIVHHNCWRKEIQFSLEQKKIFINKILQLVQLGKKLHLIILLELQSTFIIKIKEKPFELFLMKPKMKKLKKKKINSIVWENFMPRMKNPKKKKKKVLSKEKEKG